MAINVTVWNEFIHEKTNERVGRVYPDGIHGAIRDELSVDTNLEIRTATLEMPNHGLSEELLGNTDVLMWWGHKAHEQVRDDIADMVVAHVLNGMGLVALHSGHYSKPFKKLMGTSCSLSWRVIGERERVWIIDPAHPICQGLGPYFELEHEEMYGEVFDIPAPDELLMIGWYKGGEVFRSGCIFKRGRGKIFYFQPGHEEFPVYHTPEVVTVLRNALYYLKPLERKKNAHSDLLAAPCVDPVEPGILELYNIAEKPSEQYRKDMERFFSTAAPPPRQ